MVGSLVKSLLRPCQELPLSNFDQKYLVGNTLRENLILRGNVESVAQHKYFLPILFNLNTNSYEISTTSKLSLCFICVSINVTSYYDIIIHSRKELDGIFVSTKYVINEYTVVHFILCIMQCICSSSYC